MSLGTDPQHGGGQPPLVPPTPPTDFVYPKQQRPIVVIIGLLLFLSSLIRIPFVFDNFLGFRWLTTEIYHNPLILWLGYINESLICLLIVILTVCLLYLIPWARLALGYVLFASAIIIFSTGVYNFCNYLRYGSPGIWVAGPPPIPVVEYIFRYVIPCIIYAVCLNILLHPRFVKSYQKEPS